MNTFHKVLFVLAILIANCISASAIEFTVNGVRYSVNSDNTTITVAGYPNKPTGDLTIPESVTFRGLSFSVTSIGDGAFYECTGLTSVTIPNSVTLIGDGAFSGCSGLTSVTIGNSVTEIGNGAFSGCSGLTSVTIPNSVTSIGDWAFSRCSGLTSVTIPNSVTEIGGKAFCDCSGLTSVTIPNSVTTIGKKAFEGCTGLTSVTIPNSVKLIGSNAFSDSNELTEVVWNAESCNMNSCDIFGHYSESCHPFYGCPIMKLIIGDEVQQIPSYLMYKQIFLTSLTIGNSVTSIGDYAFCSCAGLTSVTIPNSVISIGNDAFYGTAWYNNQPDGLVYAGPVAYKYKGTMPSGTSIVLKEGTKGIVGEAFYKCSGLTSVTIPNSVTSIGNEAFSGCSGLTRINAYPNPEKVSTGSYAFNGVPKVGTLHVLPKYLSAYRTARQWRYFTHIKGDL